MMADGSYAQNKDDPLVRVVGPEHGGKTKVHGGLFKNVIHDIESDARLDTMRRAFGYGSDARSEFPLIELALEWNRATRHKVVELTSHQCKMRRTHLVRVICQI
ncbi:hypothetical protein QVD17_20259 [Tagetes erecta]|uniref:Uncharacterized protein n=1 Tax=Tagetes erecta TaxID=13708 RepID=A0AAD8KLD2_TARER|nr:hypothetical protein QVD17_20259 [Tagetes erecta]